MKMGRIQWVEVAPCDGLINDIVVRCRTANWAIHSWFTDPERALISNPFSTQLVNGERGRGKEMKLGYASFAYLFLSFSFFFFFWMGFLICRFLTWSFAWNGWWWWWCHRAVDKTLDWLHLYLFWSCVPICWRILNCWLPATVAVCSFRASCSSCE